MRWTEIVDHAERLGLPVPTYRKIDLWTRHGRLNAETRGDNHGRYRWWPPTEVKAALLVACLMSAGMDEDLAFRIARIPASNAGTRTLILDGEGVPFIKITVADR